MKEKRVLIDFQSSIQEFENKLSTTNTTKPPQLKDPKAFIAKIKTKKETEIIARKDRDQRRRKFLLDQNKMMEDLELQRRKDLKLEALMQESKIERELVKKLAETLKWKTVMKKNREYREQQYQNQRIADETRKLESTRLEKQQREEERKRMRDILIQRFQEREEQKRQKNAKKYQDVGENIVQGLLLLTDRNIQFKEQTEGLNPSESVKVEWNESFVRGHENVNLLEEDPSITDFLNERQLSDYLLQKNIWAIHSQKEENHYFIDILSTIEKTVNPPPKSAQSSEIEFKSRFPLRLALLGKPFSGKSVLSQTLSQQFSLHLIVPDVLIDNCLTSDSHPLFEQINLQLKLGQSISEDLIVQLIVDEIKNLESREDIQGWILDGYPNTVKCALELEKQLCGFKEISYNPKKSSLLEYEVENLNSTRHPFKSFSKIIVINTSNSEVFKRQTGQCFDPETGILYHIPFNPPPEDQNILSRLQAIEEVQIDRIQINDQIVSFSKNQEAIQSFYDKKCSTEMLVIDGNRNLDEISKNLIQVVTKIFESAEPDQENQNIETLEESTEQSVESQINKEEKTVLRSEIAQAFKDLWFGFESVYTDALKTQFKLIRSGRKKLLAQLQNLKDDFIAYLLEPETDKQSMIHTFQQEYNNIDQDIRRENTIKAELHLRLKELRDSIWKISEKRNTDSSNRILTQKKQHWFQEINVEITHSFMQLVQSEVNRYCKTAKLINDYYLETRGLLTDFDSASYDALNVDVIGDDPNAKKKAAPPKKAKDDNTFETTIPHDFDATFVRAEAILSKPLNQAVDKGKAAQTKKGSKPVQQETIPEIDEAIAKEKNVFLQRITIIKEVHQNTLKEFNEHYEHIFSKLEKWTNERYQSEVATVRELCQYVENHIENGLPMEYELKLNDDAFGVDELVQIYKNPESNGEDPSLLKIEGASLDFNHQQLNALVQKFKQAAPLGFITVDNFVTLIFCLTSSSFGNTDLPQKWLNASLETIQQIAESITISGSNIINWKEFIIHHCIIRRFGSTPSQNEIVCSIRGFYDVIGGFLNVDPEYVNSISENDFSSIQLWYHSRIPDNKSLTSKDANAILYQILHDTSGNESISNISWHVQALLYTCLDSIPIKSIKNLFYVLSEGENKLDQKSLFLLFNMNLPSSKIEFGLDQMEAVFEEYAHAYNNGIIPETISFEAFCNTSFGRNLIKQANHLQQKSVQL